MTDPGANVPDTAAGSAGPPSLVAPAFERLRQRPEFLRVAKGERFHTRAFSLQAAPRAEAGGPARFGFTVTRKAGGAVERNRMRRRLREALRRAAPLEARPGFDYVIVARRSSLDAGFDHLVSELARALRLIGARKPRPTGAGAGPDRSPAP